MHPGDLYELTRDCILRVFLRILWRPQIRSQIQTNTPQIQNDVRISWVGVPQLQIRSKYSANTQLRHVLAPSSLALGHLRHDRHPNTKPVLYLLRICGVFVVYLGWVEKYMYLFCISCVFAKYFKMVKYMGTATSGTLPRHPYF